MARGGPNGGPQYDPMKVSATGGNGQSGKFAAKKTAKAAQLRPSGGGEYRATQDLTNQIREGGNVKTTASAANPASKVPASPSPMDLAGMLPAISPLDSEPTEYLPISDGVDFGRGRGREALPPRFNKDTRQIENVELIKRYLPDMMNAARMQNAPDSFKRMVNALMKQVM